MAMDFLSMMEAKLPPGFRFHPRDEELILDYLIKRINGVPNTSPMMVDVDLNKVEPWDLPEIACVGGKEWYFYSLRDRKYATGQRTNRATLSGYWKATGKDRPVVDGRRGGKLVGMRKTLVFYQGRAPKGKKSDWVMHEFRIEADSGNRLKPPPSSSFNSTKEDWVLCRVFYKTRGHQSMKPNTTTNLENCYDDTGSSSLPPLMDTYINFEQPQPLPNLHGYERVPCFSNLQNSTSTAAFRPPPPPPNKPMQSNFSQIPDLGQPNYLSYSCEKKAIKAVLEQLSKAEDGRRPAEGSSESYLTETGGAHSMWNPFCAS